MRILRYLLLPLFAALFLYSGQVSAQSQKGIPSDGRDYYLGYIQPSITCGAIKPFQGVYALISSYYDCNVTISYFDTATGVETQAESKHILAKQYWQAPLHTELMRLGNPDGDVAEYKSCHIHSDFPVSVQYYSTGPNSGGMYLSLPTGALGETYVVAAAPANPALGAANSHHFTCTPDSSSSLFMAIAIKDNTVLTITPNGTTRGGHVGANSGKGATGQPRSYSVTLNRGQVYCVKSTYDDESVDESGSIVTGSQPFALLAGCESMYNGETRYVANQGDQRDMTVEQMVPVDYWTDVDYVSMPFLGSQTPSVNDASIGDMYKIYTYDPGLTKALFTTAETGLHTVQVGRLQNPPVTFGNVTGGTRTSSDNGKKIMVEQYSYRQMNDQEPFPAPSQMNIVPLTRYRTSYIWSVPDDKNQVHKKRYINVIAQTDQLKTIKFWKDGQGPKPLSSLTSPGGVASIPGHPELSGHRYEITPGCYYATADSAFGLYQYGDLGLDPDFDLGDNDDDDYYFTYAAPCGQSFGIDGAYSPHMEVDTSCSGWHVKIVDNNPLDRGVAQVEILNDPFGVFKRKPNSDSGYISTNAQFNPTNFTVVPGDTVVEFNVVVKNPLQDASVWLWALNVAGNDTLIHLTYKAPKLSLTPDSAAFSNVALGADTCTRFVFRNDGQPGDRIFHVTQPFLKIGGQGFTVGSTDPAVPVDLKPGDSIIVNLCFSAAEGGKAYIDTLVVPTDCPQGVAPLVGSSTYPKILATDYDFGAVTIGETKCHEVTVTNTGKAKFTLTKDWILHNVTNFSFPDSSRLPMNLDPGQSVTLTFCYTPTDVRSDSTTNDWGSNIPEPYTHLDKDYSILKGSGIKPNLLWDRLVQPVQTQCDTIREFKLYLKNNGTASILVDTVQFIGPDATEFSVIGDQLGDVPPKAPGNFGLNPGDSIYVTVRFTPDMTKPIPLRWQDRLDTLIAYDENSIDPFVVFNANVTHADLSVDKTAIDFGTVSPQQPTTQEVVTVTDPGTADLVITNITYSNTTDFSVIQPSLKVGDVIKNNGGSGTITLQGVANLEGTYYDTITIYGGTNCTPIRVVTAKFSTSQIAVAATGHDFSPTYICLQNPDNVTAVSTAGRDAILKSVEIIDDPSQPGRSDQFHFADGSRIMVVNKPLSQNQVVSYPVIYEPSLKQSVQAQVVFTFDTLDNQGIAPWTVTKLLTGTGKQEHETVSVASLGNPIYTAQTATTFEVPVRLTEALPGAADAHSVTLDFSYRRDLFRYISVIPSAGYQLVGNATTKDNGNVETLTMTVAPTGKPSFDNADDIAHVKLFLVISRDTNSEFTLSNVVFHNSSGGDICYVLNDVVPANFTPIDLCGNGIIRRLMQTGKLTFSIHEANPNPAAASVHVGVDVGVANTPLTVELFDVLGQRVRTYRANEPMPAGSTDMELDLQGIPSGTYSVRVSSPDHSESEMILVTK